MSNESHELVIQAKNVGHNGNVELTVLFEGDVIHADRIELARSIDRERFLDGLCRGRDGINRAEVSEKLLQILKSHGDGKGRGVAAEEEDEAPISTRSWPEPPNEPVWHGPAGEWAKAVEPYTEADLMAVLVQFLLGFGNLVGRNCYFAVNATRHYPNLFCCAVGPTGAGRKGTSWDIDKEALALIDQQWADERLSNGLVSGEGLIWHIRDEGGNSDKRLLVIESELGGTLKVLVREGNNLSALMRQAWDSGNLRSMSKNSPNKATGGHVSIIGHITEHEVKQYLSNVDAANGFANRFVWLAVRQSKFLPDGASIPFERLKSILEMVNTAASFAKIPRLIERDAEASELWNSVYPRLCQGRPGLLGSILGRAPAQVMRFALIYALLDCSDKIRRVHLEAALALWDYSERSAAYIFGESLGDKDADRLLEALRSKPHGLTRSQIRSEVFGRHKSSEAIRGILGRLLESNLVESEVVATEGRPATIWKAKTAPKATYAPKPPADPPEYGSNGAYGASLPTEEREVGEL